LLHSANHVDTYFGAALGAGEGLGDATGKRGSAADFGSSGSARAGADDDITGSNGLAAISSNKATVHRAKTVS
jgi:hypothetical protein